MFTPVNTSMLDILNATSQYEIPMYQRDYKWGKDEALELIEDLRSYAEDGGRLFLGSLIFEKSRGQLYVVDGQQRLTTILLLLVACRMRASDLGLHDLAPIIQGKITFIDPTNAESKGVRLIASESVRDVFEYITKGDWDGQFPTTIGKKPVKRQVNRLKPIFDYFRSQTSELDRDDLQKFLGAVYDAFAIRIEIENEVAALSIFERTNARGVELEISDLMKTYLFSKRVKGVEDLWAEILENSGGTILRMLKYFYISREGYVLKPQLYKKLKAYSIDVGAEQLTKELLEFSEFYKVTKNPTEEAVKNYFAGREMGEVSAHQHRYQKIAFALQALREFSVTQFSPPAYAAIECACRTNDKSGAMNARALIRLFDAFEKYHFVNNVVCERVGNEVERLYADSCVAFSRSSDLHDEAERLISELIKRLATRDEFIASFSQLAYSPSDVSLLCYIFDRFNNDGLDPSQWLHIYNPDPKILRRNHNIEHFFPQKPEAGWKIKKDTLGAVDNIGNLLAISYKTNSRLGNESPARKIELLRGKLSKEIQNAKYVSEFISKYSAAALAWDASKIQQRAKEMAEEAYAKVWKIQ